MKRSKWNQWWDKFLWNIKTDKDIENEKRWEAQATSVVMGHLKITRRFVPGIPQFGGGRYKEEFHYKSDYSESEWNKIKHNSIQ